MFISIKFHGLVFVSHHPLFAVVAECFAHLWHISAETQCFLLGGVERDQETERLKLKAGVQGISKGELDFTS